MATHRFSYLPETKGLALRHDALEKLARYIIRACFSSERMAYIPAEIAPDGIAKVINTSMMVNPVKHTMRLD